LKILCGGFLERIGKYFITYKSKYMKQIGTSYLLNLAFAVLITTSLNFTVNAQSNSTSQIGLRLGGFSGLNFKHIDGNNVGLEINLLESYPNNWGLVSGEIEKHFALGEGFVIYGGGGAYLADHAAYILHRDDNNIIVSKFQAGFEGVIGVDYYIPNVPVNVGFDIRPRIWYLVYPYPWDAGITIRYVIR
jgi:hypothetical protein